MLEYGECVYCSVYWSFLKSSGMVTWKQDESMVSICPCESFCINVSLLMLQVNLYFFVLMSFSMSLLVKIVGIVCGEFPLVYIFSSMSCGLSILVLEVGRCGFGASIFGFAPSVGALVGAWNVTGGDDGENVLSLWLVGGELLVGVAICGVLVCLGCFFSGLVSCEISLWCRLSGCCSECDMFVGVESEEMLRPRSMSGERDLDCRLRLGDVSVVRVGVGCVV